MCVLVSELLSTFTSRRNGVFSLVTRLRKGWTTNESCFDSLMDKESLTKTYMPAVVSTWGLRCGHRDSCGGEKRSVRDYSYYCYDRVALYLHFLIHLYPLHRDVFNVFSLSFPPRKGYSDFNCKVFLTVQYQPSV